jgi:hypothetical protein
MQPNKTIASLILGQRKNDHTRFVDPDCQSGL